MVPSQDICAQRLKPVWQNTLMVANVIGCLRTQVLNTGNVESRALKILMVMSE
jgi:hypothetical protein